MLNRPIASVSSTKFCTDHDISGAITTSKLINTGSCIESSNDIAIVTFPLANALASSFAVMVRLLMSTKEFLLISSEVVSRDKLTKLGFSII